MHILVLTTPDIRSNALNDALADDARAIHIPTGTLDLAGFGSPEARAVAAFDRSALEAAQVRWFQSPAHGFDYMAHHAVQHRVSELKNLLDGETGWTVQDTLLCRLFPAWQKVLDAPRPVFLYSHPLDCALALRELWRFPLSFGLALWESYVLSAVSNIQQHDPVLVAAAELGDNFPVVVNRVREATGRPRRSAAAAAPEIREDTGPYAHFLRPSQQRILDALDAGRLDALDGIALSDESEDILLQFGRLRAGFEDIKADRDRFRDRLRTAEPEMSDDEPAKEDPRPDVPQAAVSAVTVYIEGREPLAFLAVAESPVISMLQRCLARDAGSPDELIYLDLGGRDGESLYFMSSSLTALEVSPPEPGSIH